jgi:hypothetical protein
MGSMRQPWTHPRTAVYNAEAWTIFPTDDRRRLRWEEGPRLLVIDEVGIIAAAVAFALGCVCTGLAVMLASLARLVGELF